MWTRNFTTGQVGGPAALTLASERGRLNSGDTLAYAFGQSVGFYRGGRRVSHSGSHRGFRTHLARLPDHDLAVIVLSNLEEFDPSGVAMQVADLFLEDDSASLAAYAGDFYSEDLSSAHRVTVHAGRLVLRDRRSREIVLTRAGRDAFSSNAWFLSNVTFAREEGRVRGFTASGGRVRDVFFKKR